MIHEEKLIHYYKLPYRFEAHWIPEEQVWVASFPELPGCEAEGETEDDALAKVREVKNLWLEMALEKGLSIPEPQAPPEYSGKFLVRVPRTLHELLTMAAAREGVSLNALAIQLLSEGVERSGIKNFLRILGGQLAKVLRFADAEGMELTWFKFAAGLKLPGRPPQIQDATTNPSVKPEDPVENAESA